MENFEQRALAEANDPPHWWKRYVDDTYTVLKKDHAKLHRKPEHEKSHKVDDRRGNAPRSRS